MIQACISLNNFYLFFTFVNLFFFSIDSYIEISRFYQGYIDNEINLNPQAKCLQTCEEYTETKHYHCAEDSFCEHLTDPKLKSKLICNGAVLNCRYFDSSFNICPAVHSNVLIKYYTMVLKMLKLIVFFFLIIENRRKALSDDTNFLNTMTEMYSVVKTIAIIYMQFERNRGGVGYTTVQIAFATVTNRENTPTDTSVFVQSLQT